MLRESGLVCRSTDDGFDLVFVYSETRTLPLPAWPWLSDDFFGRDFPLFLNNVSDIFIGTAVDSLHRFHISNFTSTQWADIRNSYRLLTGAVRKA